MDLMNGYFNMPGRIVEYFAETQTATIRICAEIVYNTTDGLDVAEPRGIIEGVPVHTPSGGGWSMTMPIEPGDTCIILFSQLGYDHWLLRDEDGAGSSQGSPNYWLERTFDINDGYALVGLNTLPRAISGYSSEDSQWRNSDAAQVISLNKDLSITIDSPTAVTINAPEVNVVSEVANITAPVVNITTDLLNAEATVTNFTGNVTISGTLATTGLITAAAGIASAGIVFNTHVHPPGNTPPAGPSLP